MNTVDRLFLDANVIFSAAYGSPKIGLLWEQSRRGRCQLLASGYVIEEARRNLSLAEQHAHLDALITGVERVPEAPPDLPCPVELPDKDQPVLLAAIACGATHLITGDVTHFGPYYGRQVRKLLILPPAAYPQGFGERGRALCGLS